MEQTLNFQQSARIKKAPRIRAITGVISWRHLLSPAPWMVLIISLSISLFASYLTWRSTHAKQEARYQQQVADLLHSIESRLAAYRSVLHSAQGLFLASEQVNRDEWRIFERSLRLSEYYPGIQGLGYAKRITPDELQDFEDAIRAEGFSGFAVKPAGKREIYSAIKYLEPFDWRNQRAFGYDMYSNPVRRAAMDRAWQTGESSISGRVVLLQETDDDTQYGFLMYHPHFASADRNSIGQEDALIGWVYAAFRVNDLMQGIFPSSAHEIMFELNDFSQGNMLPMYQSNTLNPERPEFSSVHNIQFGGRVWELKTKSLPNFEAGSELNFTSMILAAGLIESISLFVMALAFVATRAHARENDALLKEIQESELRTSVLLNSMTTALIAVDSSGRIVEANDQAADLFEYDKDRLKSMSVDALVPAEFMRTHKEKREGYVRHPSQRAMGGDSELYGLKSNGEQVPVEIGLSPLKLSDELMVIATIVDITERINDQQEKEQLMHQLSKKNTEMEQFVYTVSHDLKAPLVTIRGFAKLLQNSLGEGLSEKQAHWLERISENLNSMEKLLIDLLELSRIIHKDLKFSDVDIPNLVKEVCAGLEGSIQGQNFRLIENYQFHQLRGQEQLIHQCLQNLISNAIQYRSPDRDLVLEISTYEEDGAQVVEIRDNGIGIDAKYHDKVFQIFERLSPDASAGNGVGLSIVKTAMEKHHGTAEVVSNDDFGVSFKLRFPAA